mmetsp:Transcript_2703/g.10422  ORF Transcript_2703/g.10422 Transcript_2703/m.10422 type:complete len:210 (+) Transcript_2703:60-689(+)
MRATGGRGLGSSPSLSPSVSKSKVGLRGEKSARSRSALARFLASDVGILDVSAMSGPGTGFTAKVSGSFAATLGMAWSSFAHIILRFFVRSPAFVVVVVVVAVRSDLDEECGGGFSTGDVSCVVGEGSDEVRSAVSSVCTAVSGSSKSYVCTAISRRGDSPKSSVCTAISRRGDADTVGCFADAVYSVCVWTSFIGVEDFDCGEVAFSI